MICPDCGNEAAPTYTQHLHECKPYNARILYGGAMVHTPGRTPLNPTGQRKTKCDAPGWNAPDLLLSTTCAKHAPKVARSVDGMCKCGRGPRRRRRATLPDSSGGRGIDVGRFARS